MNMFRHYATGKLDKQFLRVCSTHRLFDCGVITKDRAIELLLQRRISSARATVELWAANPKQSFTA